MANQKKEKVAVKRYLRDRISLITGFTIVVAIDIIAIYYIVLYYIDIYNYDPVWGWFLVLLIFVALGIANAIPLLKLADRIKKRQTLKCPYCDEVIKDEGPLGQKKIKCNCGAQIKIGTGLFHYYIKDWQLLDDNN
ncbi:hypothetical protein ACFLVP_00920 [Chloroflexota bacterium]